MRNWTNAAEVVARELRERGVGVGDRVALAAENGERFLAAFFGVVYVGATVVPVPILSALRRRANGSTRRGYESRSATRRVSPCCGQAA